MSVRGERAPLTVEGLVTGAERPPRPPEGAQTALDGFRGGGRGPGEPPRTPSDHAVSRLSSARTGRRTSTRGTPPPHARQPRSGAHARVDPQAGRPGLEAQARRPD